MPRGQGSGWVSRGADIGLGLEAWSVKSWGERSAQAGVADGSLWLLSEAGWARAGMETGYLGREASGQTEVKRGEDRST